MKLENALILAVISFANKIKEVRYVKQSVIFAKVEEIL